MRRMGISLGMRPELRTTCGGKRGARGRGVAGQFSTKGKYWCGNSKARLASEGRPYTRGRREKETCRKKEGHPRRVPLRLEKLDAASGLALRCWSGGGHGGVADGVAVDDELDAAVALAAFGGVVGGDGLHFAEAAGGDGRTGDALLRKEIADGIGAAFGELLVEIVAADAVGVALDLERQAGMREDDAGNFGELFACAGLEGVAAGVKKNIRHVDDEAASGVA